MARKTLIYTVSEDNRDKGKRFLLTEMPSLHAERWATRMLMGMVRSGVDLPPDIEKAGMAAIATVTFKAMAMIPFDIAEPLLNEMLTCIQVLPDPANPDVTTPFSEYYVEEVETIIKLRKEVLGLHINFSTAVEKLRELGTK